MKVIKNYIYNVSYQFFIMLIPLLTTPYLSRVIGPKGVGINSYTSSVIQYFIIFGCLGTNIYANRKISYVRDDKYKMSQCFWEILILRFIMLFLSYALFILVLFILNPSLRIYYIIQSISIIATIFDISWFFVGIEKFNIMVRKNIIIKIVSVIAIFSMVKSLSDINIYLIILTVSSLFGNIVMFLNLKNEVYYPKMRELDFMQHLKPSILLFIPEIATQVYLVLNKTMLGFIVSIQASGYYDQSDKLVKIVLSVVTASGAVMLPHVANAFVNGKKDKVKKYLYDSFELVTCISIPMAVGIVSISNKLVPLFLSSKFSNVAPLVSVESLVIVLIAWSNTVGVQYLLPTKQTKKYTQSVIIGALINIVVNIPLIIVFGTIGAILSTVISEISVTAYQLFSIRKQVSIRRIFHGLKVYTISGIVMGLIVYFMDTILPHTWLYLSFEVISGVIIYVSLLIFQKSNVFNIIKGIKDNY